MGSKQRTKTRTLRENIWSRSMQRQRQLEKDNVRLRKCAKEVLDGSSSYTMKTATPGGEGVETRSVSIVPIDALARLEGALLEQ